MILKTAYALLLFSIFSSQADAQRLSRLLGSLPVRAESLQNAGQETVRQECEPDSILGYGYLSPSDSILGERRVFYHYEQEMSVAEYIYQDQELELYQVDSTVFNAAGLPVFKEIWEMDEDVGQVAIQSRTFAYPHENAVQADPFFYQSLREYFDPSPRGRFALYDSIVFHETDFFSGVLEPNEKIVNAFTPEEKLLESTTYDWSSFGSAWDPFDKRINYYSPEGRIERSESYYWDGAGFALDQTADYIYDANDSLSLLLIADGATGTLLEKGIFTYDTEEHTSAVVDSLWDENTGEWVFVLYFLTDYDGQGRLEKTELLLNFFGLLGIREEFEYAGDCPRLRRLYESEDGLNWEFVATYYYYPYTLTSVSGPLVSDWQVYPNPASEGIWLEVPPGIPVTVADMQGRVIYRGFAKGRAFIPLPRVAGHYVAVTLGEGKAASSRLILLRHR